MSQRQALIAGDGLAGAACAAALAKRGWRVDVLGLGDAPASGASGLPVGVLAPLLSASDPPASQMLRAALASTLAYARAHLRQGIDFSDCGVLERRVGKKLGLSLTPTSGATPSSREAKGHELACFSGEGALGDPVVWHQTSGWVKPAALVRALLATPSVTWHGQSRLLSGQSTESGAVAQVLQGAAGQSAPKTWAADVLVLALGSASVAFLGAAKGLYPVRGQLSMGRLPPVLQADAAFTGHPINGHGSWTGGVDLDGENSWVCGATYERGERQASIKPADHAANFAKLQRLLPRAAAAVAQQFEQGEVRGWSGVRCTTADRLPVVGPMLPGPCHVWLCTGLGSRGLSWSVWCGELLAARCSGEALPVPADWAQRVDSQRPLR